MLIHAIDGINRKSLATLAAIIVVVGSLLVSGGATSAVLMAAALTSVVIAFIFFHMAVVKASITRDCLVVGGGLYTVRVPLHGVFPHRAALAQRGGGVPDLCWRTNGIGVPGLSLGWFRTSDGQKVFGAVTDFRRAVLLPTSLGYDIVASPEDPARFVADLCRQLDASDR